MEIYVTSKNSGPSWHSDPVFLIYIGTSLEEAVDAVGDFKRYERDPFPTKSFYSALPKDIEREMVHYYAADGWWYSVEKVVF